MNKVAPPELNQPFPGRFRVSGSFQFLLTVIIVNALGVAVLVIMINFKDAYKMAILKTRGVAAEGNLVKRYATPNRHGGRFNYSIDYRL
ncbi:MAG: hypothetical protein ACREC9_01975 [Methylocella sp.]